jgi:hypothetical protein
MSFNLLSLEVLYENVFSEQIKKYNTLFAIVFFGLEVSYFIYHESKLC